MSYHVLLYIGIYGHWHMWGAYALGTFSCSSCRAIEYQVESRPSLQVHDE